jgi:hypothetical protein
LITIDPPDFSQTCSAAPGRSPLTPLLEIGYPSIELHLRGERRLMRSTSSSTRQYSGSLSMRMAANLGQQVSRELADGLGSR